MIEPTKRLKAQLVQDLTSVYLDGLELPARPARLPALSELAKSLDPNASGLGEAIEGLLHRSIAALATKTQLFTTRAEDVKLGLTDLFDLGEARGLLLTARRDRAGPYLGYPNGNEGLRKAERNKTDLAKVLINEWAEWLVTLANHEGFTYIGRFDLDPPLHEVPAKPIALSSSKSIAASVLSTELLKDLYTICAVGLEQAASSRPPTTVSQAAASEHLVAITSLARHVFQADDSEPVVPIVTSIVMWAIDQMDEHDSWRRLGLEVLLSVDNESKDKSLVERCKEAEDWIGGMYDPEHRFPGWAVEILLEMRNHLLALAAESDYWVSGDPRELDSGLIRYWERLIPSS